MSIPSFASPNDVIDDAYYYLQTDHFKIAFSGKYWKAYLKKNNITNQRLRDEHKPQFAFQIGEWAEEAWEGVFVQMDYQLPVAYATGNYIIVLQEFQPSHLGVTVPNKQFGDETDTIIAVNITSTNSNIRSTIVHELYHVAEFGYDPFKDLRYATKMAEGAAVWSEDEVLDDLNTYERFFDQSFYQLPQESLFGSRGQIDAPDSISRYGTFLWFRFLSEKFGQQIVREFWEEYQRFSKAKLIQRKAILYSDYLVQKKVLETKYSTSLAAEYMDFALQNIDSQFYEEGELHPELKKSLKVSQLPFKSGPIVNQGVPRQFGSNSVSINTLGKEGTLVVNFQGSKNASFAVSLVPMKGKNAELENKVTQLGEIGKGLDLQLPLSGEEEVIMMISVVDSDADLKDTSLDVFTSILYGYEFSASLAETMPELILKTPSPELQASSVERQISISSPMLKTSPRRTRLPRAKKIFKDLSENHRYAKAIQQLKRQGVLKGYSNGTFQPDQPVNRAEFVKIIVESAFAEDLAGGECFPDVDSSLWFAAYVCTAANKNIVGGFPDGSFGPTKKITVAAAYKVVLEAFVGSENIPEVEGQWYLKYTEYAKNNGVSHEPDFDPTQNITRAEMAQLMYLVMGEEN